MHIAFFADQHPATLGGLQVSLSLQRQHLEAQGHHVTVCAPTSKRMPTPQYARSSDVLLSAIQVGEHSFCLAGSRYDEMIDRAFARKLPVDCVHVQGDVWGAWNGHRFATRHDLPLVQTMHTNIEVGLPALLPFPSATFRLLFAAQRHFLKASRIASIADYTREFGNRVDVLIAPSAHFAQRLRGYGIDRHIHVLPTGVDDSLAIAARQSPRAARVKPVLMWPGRISEEKRIGDFFDAFARANITADVHVYGAGPGLAAAQRRVEQLGIGHCVTFFGAVPHHCILRAMKNADAIVQSSLDYETQGLTVYEAVSVGTPVILRDRNIATDLPGHMRHPAADESISSFAATIRQFVHAQPAERHRPVERFMQSRLTAQAVELYRSARALHDQHPANHQRTSHHAA